jgi:hypothetical protein
MRGEAAAADHIPPGGVRDDHLAIGFRLNTNGLNHHVVPISFKSGGGLLAGAEDFGTHIAAGFGPFVFGCGSFKVGWLRCEIAGFAVSGVVDTLVFAAEVVAPAGVEVAAGDEGAEREDGLSAFQPPSCARYVHSVVDDVPARAFDDPGGDGPAFLQRPGVVQVVLLVVQVAGAFVGAGSPGGRVAVGGGAAADAGCDLAGVAAQDLAGLVSDPFPGCRLPLVVEGPGGLPQVFEHVDEVGDDRGVPRLAAPAVTASICVLLPSIRITRSRW